MKINIIVDDIIYDSLTMIDFEALPNIGDPIDLYRNPDVKRLVRVDRIIWSPIRGTFTPTLFTVKI